MSLSLTQKQAVVAEVTESISAAQAMILAEYRGLSVSQLTGMRAAAREAGVFVRVVKNTLARRVVAGSPFEGLSEHFVGPVIMTASDDPVAVAKLVSKFSKDIEPLKITVGVMDGELINESQIQALAKLPSREELLATLVGTMQAPIAKLVQTLNEVPSRFVRTLAALEESRQAA
ncbi:MAG: 50S ribosomal protein L10 [marine bacterium B5-7]|nr:MAG: 50S ribosomal protein L10 [marine bacterium B5-7]